jgi:hypothetical protein
MVGVLELPLQPFVLVTKVIAFPLQAFGPLAPLLGFSPQSLIFPACAPPLHYKPTSSN